MPSRPDNRIIRGESRMKIETNRGTNCWIPTIVAAIVVTRLAFGVWPRERCPCVCIFRWKCEEQTHERERERERERDGRGRGGRRRGGADNGTIKRKFYCVIAASFEGEETE